MVRGIGLLMGVSLLLMVGILSPLRQEASEAFLVASLSIEPEDNYGIVVTTPFGQRLRRLTTNPTARLDDFLIWSQDGNNIYYLYEPPEHTHLFRLQRISFPKGRTYDITEPQYLFEWRDSPDGNWALISDGLSDSIYRLDMASGETRYIVDGVKFFGWSHDSEWINFKGAQLLWNTMPVDGGEIILDNTLEQVWSLDEQQIIYSEFDGQSEHYFHQNLDTGEITNLDEELFYRIRDWTTNNWVIIEESLEESGFTPMLSRIRPAGEQYAPLLNIGREQVLIDVIDDGQWVYISTSNAEEQTTEIYRVNPATLENEYILSLEQLILPQFSLDKGKLIFMGRYIGENGLYSMNQDGTDLRQLAAINEWYEWRYNFSPTPEWIVVAYEVDYKVYSRQLVNIYTGEIQELPRSSTISFSPLIDRTWAKTQMFVIGTVLLLGAVGVMGWRMRRTT